MHCFCLCTYTVYRNPCLDYMADIKRSDKNYGTLCSNSTYRNIETQDGKRETGTLMREGGEIIDIEINSNNSDFGYVVIAETKKTGRKTVRLEAHLITNMRNTTTAFIPRGRACDHDDYPASPSTWMVHVVDNGGDEEDELVHGSRTACTRGFSRK